MTKNVKDIRDEFFDEGKLSAQSIKDLIWHIENDQSPDRAISLVTDAYLTNGSLGNLIPMIAKHLDNEDDFIRELTVGCIVGRIKLPDYAEKAFNMAKEDPDSGTRILATSSLGAILNKVNLALQKQISTYLYEVFSSSEYENLHKQCAFDSILEAMGMPISQIVVTTYDANHYLVNKFKLKYGV